MLVDALLQQEVEGHMDRPVEEVEELESKRADWVDELMIKVAKEVVEDDRNVNVGNNRNGCSYKDFVACKPKEFDGKGGVVAYIRWVEKIEAVQDISGCGDNQKVKYSASSLTGRALTWWNSEVRTRGREVAVGMTWEDFKALMKEEYCPRNEMQRLEIEFWNHVMVVAGHSAYTDQFHELSTLVPHLVTPETKRIERYIYGLSLQIYRNGSLKRSGERRGDDRESSKEGNVKHDNKRARTGKVFATITNPVRKEYMGSTPKCTNCNFHHNPETPYRACMNYNRLGQGGNHPNQEMAIEGGLGRGNNGNLARGRAFVM
ncbi:reverse transcriptase domain-containing protein [Tanacetum coccineum]